MSTLKRSRLLVLVSVGAVLTSGYIHFYLYFRDGYRNIAPEDFAGITISRAFAANAIAGAVIAELLVLSLLFARLRAPAALIAIGFGASTIGAYILVRTTGLLGFTDDQTSTEAVIAFVAETVAMVAGLAILVGSLRNRSSVSDRSDEAAASSAPR